MEFLSYTELDGVPHIVVDGTAHKDSVIVLSHWANSGTNPGWIRDTSAEIVFDYLDHHSIPSYIKYVSNDHYDQDGLVAMIALVNPHVAQKYRELLIDVAEAGDFGTYKDRKAARIAMALINMIAPDSGYFEESAYSLPYPQMAALFYEKGLELLPEMLEDIDSFKALWEEEDEFLSYSEDLVKQQRVSIEEDVDNDMAVVTIPTGLGNRNFHRFSMNHFGAIHDIAIHNATRRARLFYIHGKKVQFKFRYETWVQLKNNIHPLRVNLSPLAEKLSQIDCVKWTYDGSKNLVPLLCPEESRDTSLQPQDVLGLLTDELKFGAVDWNPYRQCNEV